jgi:AraC-like DNA-binding protein
MTKLKPTPQTDTRTHVVLSIDIKYLSQTVAGLMQQGIHFTINYSPSQVKYMDSTEAGSMTLSDEILSDGVPNTKRLFMQTIEQVIRESILSGKTPIIEDVAKAAGMKGSKVNAQLGEVTGKTFNQFYITKKMEYAAELLRMGYNAHKTSEKIGYTHPIKFNKMFQKHFGITPHQYRKKYESEKAS